MNNIHYSISWYNWIVLFWNWPLIKEQQCLAVFDACASYVRRSLTCCFSSPLFFSSPIPRAFTLYYSDCLSLVRCWTRMLYRWCILIASSGTRVPARPSCPIYRRIHIKHTWPREESAAHHTHHLTHTQWEQARELPTRMIFLSCLLYSTLPYYYHLYVGFKADTIS